MNVITETEFDEKYTLLVDNEQDASTAFDSIEDIKERFGNSVEVNRLWTYIDGDGDTTYIVAGVHFVNAFAYAVSEEQHDGYTTVKLDDPDE